MILLVIPLAYGISFDDLYDSYDYSYDGDGVTINSFTTYGGGEAPPYDAFAIDINMDLDGGSYSVIGDLFLDGEFITTSEIRFGVESGTTTIYLLYPAEKMVNGTYNLSLTINQDFLRIYRNKNAYSFEFNDTDYIKPTINAEYLLDALINTDGDPEFEFLEVNVSVNGSVSGDVAVYIKDNNKTLVAREGFEEIPEIVSLRFNAEDLVKYRMFNPVLYKIEVDDYIFNVNQALTVNNLDSTSVFTDIYSETVGDDLDIDVGVDIKEAGTYYIEADLYDEYNNFVTSVNQSFELTTGVQTVILTFDGAEVYASGFNGPYVVKVIKLVKQGVLDSQSDVFTTSSLDYSDFSKPPMPDLIVTDLSMNDSLINVTIKNIGQAYAFGFTLTIFDEEFNKTLESVIPSLAPDEELNFMFNNPGIITVYAIVDYLNNVEELNESNNVKQYPESSDCVEPGESLTITEDTVICEGSYNVPGGIILETDNVSLVCQDSLIVGDNTSIALNISNVNNVSVENCTFVDYQSGILLEQTSNSWLTNNNVSNMSLIGIHLLNSEGNTLRNNVMDNNYNGFGVEEGWINDIDDSNTINNLPVIYLINPTNLVIGEQAGYIVIINGDTIEINNQIINSALYGLTVVDSNDLIVDGSRFSNGKVGMYIDNVDNLELRYNKIDSNSLYGIQLIRSTGLVAYENEILDNKEGILAGANVLLFTNNDLDNEDYNFIVDIRTNVVAENNYWGTVINSEIQDKIFDGIDDRIKGRLDYSPYKYYNLHHTNSPPVLEEVSNLVVNEAEQVQIVLSGSDVDEYDNLVYSIDDLRFSKVGSTFSYTTADGSVGSFTVTVDVSDGSESDSQEVLVTVQDVCTPDWVEVNGSCQEDNTITGSYVDVNSCYATTGLGSDNNPPVDNTYACDYCTPVITNTTWSGWSDVNSCLADDTQEQERTLTEYDANFCGEVANVTHTETQFVTCDFCTPSIDYTVWSIWSDVNSCLADDTQEQERTRVEYDVNYCGEVDNVTQSETRFVGCDFCTPTITNTTWSGWSDVNSCLADDTQEQERTLTEYDANFCGEVANVTHSETQFVTCDFCTPSLDYTVWSGWSDVNSCLADDTQEQERTRVEYDVNYCGEVDNVTHSETQFVTCDFCTPSIDYTVWSSWSDVNSCLADDTQEQERTRVEYDVNFCGEVANVTHSETQFVTCDFCTPSLDYTVWSGWSDVNSCLADDTQEQERTRVEYDVNFCGEVANVTHSEIQFVSCDFCIPDWVEVNSTCVNEIITGSYEDVNDCYALTGLEDDNNAPADNTYACVLPIEYIKFNISLNAGWNLISFPIDLRYNRVSDIFTDYDSIFMYNGLMQELDDNSIINENFAYWVEVSSNQVIEVEGLEFNDSIVLGDGWNMVGHKSLSNQVINGVETVYAYDNGWLTWQNSRPWNDFSEYEPGIGYWVDVETVR